MLKSVYERVEDMATSTESVDLVGDEAATNLARAALFAALVGAFAYVTFPNPVSPVSVTLQVLGVFLAGIYLGPVWGAGSLVLYLAAGALGAPVFQGGSAGVGQLVGQSAGYLWSYPLAAAAVGAVVHRGAAVRDLDAVGLPTLVGAMALGTAVIYGFGVAGLALVLSLGPVEAVTVGAAAFLPAEALKIAAAVGVVRSDAIAAA
jgi:biotin transport system substrate-specific component